MFSRGVSHLARPLFLRNLSTSNVSQNVVAKKRSWIKLSLITISVPSTIGFAYYQLALNAQEKRKVKVQNRSVGRALR